MTLFKKTLFSLKCQLLLLTFFHTQLLFSRDTYSLDHALMSIYAVQCDNGKVLINKDSGLSLMPASCLKIVTTAAALHLLGADYRFETHLEYDGFIDSTKTLHGHVYIKGEGDPCLGSDRISGALSWKKQIETWADALQHAGIQKIKGTILGDATKWEKTRAVPSWAWEDLGNYYGAGACALSFHENFYHLVFTPGHTVGETADILRTDPPLSLVIHNEVKTGPEGSGDQACIYGSEFSTLQFVQGTIPAGVAEFAIKGSIPYPATTCAELLIMELQARGIVIEKAELTPSSHRTCVHTTCSPTLEEIVYWTNQKSINLYAEHLFKKMGEVAYKEGSTSSGIKALLGFLEAQKIDCSGLNIADGSGLSRKNLITTKQLVDILLTMKGSEFFPVFFDSLPQYDDLIKAKSGSLSLVKGYAGYVGNVAFAILINNCSNHTLINEKIHLVFNELKSLNQ